jgi:hypothetical protein
MTTKPKTRKAPAKRAAPKAARKQAPGEQKREVTDVRKLVSRWHWLEADQEHRANIAKTEDESEKLITIHNDEQEEIESQLIALVPTNYLDACYLLEFATILAEGACMAEGADVAMLKNVREGLRLARRDELETERKAGMKEMHESICTIIDLIREPNILKAVSTSLQRIDKARTGSPGP